ncbi:MAK10-like protein [Tanacetum coccineum]
MGDENPIRTLGDYSNPSHKGYRNTIELLEGNNVVLLRSDTIRFRERICPYPQPQALGTTFEAQVRDYMAAHTKRIERFENAIFKQREEINDRMTDMFGLLKELTTSRAPKRELIKEEARYPITKNINSISLIRGEEEKNANDNATPNDSIERLDGSDAEVTLNEVKKENKAENGTKNEPIKSFKRELTQVKEEESVESHSSQPVGGPVYEAILKKKITKKEDIGGNFEIPCNIGGLNHMNALVDQGSNVNVMPLFTYKKLTNERPAETDIKLSLASHSYIYALGIAKDVLVDVAGYVYPVVFMVLDITEDEKRPFILGTPFLTTAKSVIKFDKGTINLRSRKSKMSFHRILESLYKIEKGIKNDIEPIAPTMTMNRLVLKWEERIRLHQEKEMELDLWMTKTFKK